MLGTVKLTRNVIKSKFVYICWWIGLDGAGSWSFGNNFARIVVIFGVDNSSSSHTDNQKKILLVLGKGHTDDINDSTGTAEKIFSIY